MSATTSSRARRLAGLAGLLAAGVLLVAGKAATAPAPTKAALAAPTTPPPSGRSPAAAPPTSGTTSAAGTATPVTATVLGKPEDVGYGIVQVRLTLTAGHITDVQALQLPSGGRSSEITAYAAPRLRREVLAAQSAKIDTVSGASFTSEGYAKSVQSALDAAPR